MPPHSSINFEVQKQYRNKQKYNDIYSRNNLLKVKDQTQIINLDEYKLTGINWIALDVNGDNDIYIDNFGVEQYSKKIEKFIDNKKVKINIQKIQENDSIKFVQLCIGFIDFMLKGKILLDYTNLLKIEHFQ